MSPRKSNNKPEPPNGQAPQVSTQGPVHGDEEDDLDWSFLGARKAKPKAYLWRPYIRLGSVTILNGKKGSGKSLVCGALAAYTTGGPALPGTDRMQPRSVMWMTYEMDYEEDVHPLVECSEGDFARVLPLPISKESGERVRLTLPMDEDLILAKCLEHNVALIIIDPISDFLSPGCDIMGQVGARAWMRSLTKICRAANAAAVVIQHLVKSGRGEAIDQGQGHADLVNLGRAVLRAQCLVADHSHVLAVVRMNGGKRPPAIEFSPEVIGANARVKWGDASQLTAEQLADADADKGERDAREDAKRLLDGILAKGPAWYNDLLAEARRAGISETTLRRAKVDRGYESWQPKGCKGEGWAWGQLKDRPKKPKK